MTSYKIREYNPGMPIGNYKVRQYKGGGSYITFGLKDGKNKEPDTPENRKRRAQIYGQYKDPLKIPNHQYKKVHWYKPKQFVPDRERYNYIYFGKNGRDRPPKEDEDEGAEKQDEPELPAIVKENTTTSINSNLQRAKSDVSLPAIVPVALVERSNSDVPQPRKKSKKGNGSFYPASYQGGNEYNSKYKYKHHLYQLKDPYKLTGRNYYGFTHSIDKNKPRVKRNYDNEDDPPPVVAAAAVVEEEEKHEEEPVKEEEPEPEKEPTPEPEKEPTPGPEPTPTPAPRERTPSPEVFIAAAAVPVITKTPTPEPVKEPTPEPEPTPTPQRSPTPARTPTPAKSPSPSPVIPAALLAGGAAAAVGGMVVAGAAAKSPSPLPLPEPEPEPEIQPSPSPEPELAPREASPPIQVAPLVAAGAIGGMTVAAAPQKKEEPLSIKKPIARPPGAPVIVAADQMDRTVAGGSGAKESITRSMLKYRFR